MIQFNIPGVGELKINHLLFDYNGTIAVDGIPVPGIKKKMNRHAKNVNIHVITADTFGTVKKALEDVDCSVVTLEGGDHRQAKANFLEELGPENTVAVGNGANDELMLKDAALGIAVLLEEGMNTKTLVASDIMVRDVADVFSYLEKPDRLVAALRV